MTMSNLEKQFVNAPGHSANVARQAERLLAYAQPAPGKRYLDVGTGNGAAAVHMARTYRMDVTGVDLDPAQIALAQEAGHDLLNVRFQTVDGRDLPFDDASFDIVSTFKVTHHIPNWQAAVAEMLRVVKPGGYFVYNDLVLPSWLATVAQKVIRFVGFPTVRGLAEIAPAEFELVYESQALLSYRAVFCRSAVEG